MNFDDEDDFEKSRKVVVKSTKIDYQSDDWVKGYPDRSQLNKVEQLQQLKEQSMQRQLDSTTRCLSSIYESESVGVAAAEELVRQGDQLDNVERNVEKILSDTKESQRHLNSIKSVLGGIKNWWSGEPKKKPEQEIAQKHTNTVLSQAMSNKSNTSNEHPGLRTKGFYDTDEVDDYDSFNVDNVRSSRALATTAAASMARNEPKKTDWQQYDEGMNKNLDLMSNGLSNLKMLAQSLGSEIEVQNSQIERINDKADKADLKVRNQNLQMKHLLGK